ncbi:MAG TPA: efflux RND transporter periplasmic adaptor subunit, partial [Thermoanaerobaculia bacterium]|nr:efflux RND transporter periplasmic adaptor subunit [Thermoanaerobaculia bacterium]
KTDAAKMRPGMRFQGTIELGRVKNAVLIPRESVFVGAAGPFVQRRGTLDVEPVRIRLGRENDAFVEVLEGLQPGDRVLVAKESEEEAKS